LSIYLDAVWFLNLCFDGLLLMLTAVILKRKMIFWRILAGAFIGSLIVIFMFTPFSEVVAHPITKIIFSVSMVYIAFGYKRFRFFLQGLLCFYFSAFIVGGGLIGLHYFINTNIFLSEQGFLTVSSGLGDPVSWIFVIIGFPLIWFFAHKRIEDIEIKKIQYDQIVQVSIEIEGKLLQLRGLVDSGNQLYDPITKTPVMVLDMKKADHMLPPSLIEAAKNLDHLSFEQIEWENRIRIIPYRGVGLSHQFLLAIKPDKIMINTGTENIQANKALIALNTDSLSSDDEYDCLLHPKMIAANRLSMSAS
jgi:stage II sporulation protein GA (sporulation sigma-E factor processing peptidase)